MRHGTTAIIGSGPAGLSCAHFLSMLDRRSEIFEAETVPGGLLATGIPHFRLPRPGLNETIERIISGGPLLRLRTRVERRSELLNLGFSTLFIATGAQSGRLLDLEGERSRFLVDALEYLRSYCLRRNEITARDKVVAVIGAGHTAFDAARAAVKEGASLVSIYYRRGANEIGAYKEEIESALSEGVKISTLCEPRSFAFDTEAGSTIRMVKTRLTEPDTEGRQFAVPIDGKEFDVACDLVVRAVGQSLPDQSVYGDFGRSRWGGLEADYQTGATKLDGVFAGGDCVLGASSVLRAIDSGKRAALAIDTALGGKGILPAREERSIQRPFGLFNPIP